MAMIWSFENSSLSVSQSVAAGTDTGTVSALDSGRTLDLVNPCEGRGDRYWRSSASTDSHQPSSMMGIALSYLRFVLLRFASMQFSLLYYFVLLHIKDRA